MAFKVIVQEVFALSSSRRAFNFEPNIVKKSFSLSKLIDLYEFLINQALPIPLAVKLTYNELIEAQ